MHHIYLRSWNCWIITVTIIGLSTFLLPLPSQATSLPTVRIAALYDGPHSNLGLGKFIRQGMIQKETLSLTNGEFDVQLPKAFQVHEGWSTKKVDRTLTDLLRQPSVDIILTLGILSTNAVLQRKESSKQVVAPFC